jgi:hypothetical protein
LSIRIRSPSTGAGTPSTAAAATSSCACESKSGAVGGRPSEQPRMMRVATMGQCLRIHLLLAPHHRFVTAHHRWPGYVARRACGAARRNFTEGRCFPRSTFAPSCPDDVVVPIEDSELRP